MGFTHLIDCALGLICMVLSNHPIGFSFHSEMAVKLPIIIEFNRFVVVFSQISSASRI